MDYRREIDGLRALAVLPVILFHAGFQTFSGGFVGVDVFFVISGYLITSIILDELKQERFSIVSFYERRVRRILPALFFVMLVCLPFAWLWLLPADMKLFAKSVVAVSLFSSNILFWSESGYFETSAELKPLLHTWSLAVEEQYYVVFPVLLAATWRLGKRWVFGTLSVLGASSLAVAHWASTAQPEFAFFMLITRGWELLLGAFVAFYLRRTNTWKVSRALSEICGVVGITMFLFAVFTFSRQTRFPGLNALVPTVGTALVILFATRQTMVGKLIGNKCFVGIGLISYSAYLWHQPILAFARHRSLEEPGKLILSLLVIASFVLAYFSWKYVETPIRLKRSLSSKQVFWLGSVATVAYLAFGWVGIYSNGLSNRYTANQLSVINADSEESRSYVERRFSELQNRELSGIDLKKVVIIGDSYAKDLVNALFESELSVRYDLSTRYISKNCGNLFVSRINFESFVEEKDKDSCGVGLYEDRDLRRRMKAADEVWFASSWMNWQLPYLSQSVSNVSNFTAKPVRVFGRKHFGNTKFLRYLDLPPSERANVRTSVPNWQRETNNYMANELPPDVFVDIQKLLCGSDREVCFPFTDSGELKTFDQTHLTPAGAKYYGEQLRSFVLQ